MSSAAQYDIREPVRQRLHIVPTLPAVDLAAAQKAAADLLVALGVGIDSGPMVETPRRMAETYAEILSGSTFDLTPLESTEQSDGLLLVDDIPVRSLCERHMLPFGGVAQVGYLPGERILGPSKVARVVDYFCHRPQTQQRLTKQVAEYLQEQLSPRGIGVVVEAEHSCRTLRGAQAVEAGTVASTLLGVLPTTWSSRVESLSSAGGRWNPR